MQAQEFADARAAQPKPELKSLYSRGNFGPEFIEAAKAELPFTWGRMSLLEEFYSANAPGMGERSRIVSDQLGKPTPMKRGLLAKVRMMFNR